MNPAYSLEGLMLKLKVQYFGHLIADSLDKTLVLGKIEGRRRGQQKMRWLDSITDSMDDWDSMETQSSPAPGNVEKQGNLACCSPWGHKEPYMTEWLTTKNSVTGFCGGSVVKSACNAGDQGSIHGSGRSPGEWHGYPHWCSCLENSMDGGAWQATFHEVAKSQTWLSQ